MPDPAPAACACCLRQLPARATLPAHAGICQSICQSTQLSHARHDCRIASNPHSAPARALKTARARPPSTTAQAAGAPLAWCNVMEMGIEVTVNESKSLQASVLLPKELFQEWWLAEAHHGDVPREPLGFV